MDGARDVKCPECAAQDQRSRIYPGCTVVTAMCTDYYYDEDGVFHHHDPNVRSTDYTCSNGHRWFDSVIPECPVDGCAYNVR